MDNFHLHFPRNDTRRVWFAKKKYEDRDTILLNFKCERFATLTKPQNVFKYSVSYGSSAKIRSAFIQSFIQKMI